MNKNAIWWVVGGLAAGAAIIYFLRPKKSQDTMLDTAIMERELPSDIPLTTQPRSSGQTLAESFAVILRRDQPKKPKEPKAPRQKKEAA